MTSTSSVIDGTQLDISKISFGKLTRNANGSKSVRIMYDNGPLTIQTPMMNIPWNLNPPFSEKDNKKDKKDDDDDNSNTPDKDGKKITKWSLQMSFIGHDSKDGDKNTVRLKKFYENMRALDKLILEKIVANRQEWFDDDDKSMDKSTATAIYSRLFRPSIKDKKNKTTKEAYPPCIDPKVNFIDGAFQCNCFTMNREKIDKPMDKISLKKSMGEGIIRLTNFYIQQANCGPTWTLMRLRADETAALSDFGFIDVDEDDDVPIKKNVVIQDLDDDDDEEEQKPVITKSSAKATVVESDDDDDEDGNAEDEEPEPAPVVVKGKKAPAKAPVKGAKK